MEVKTKRFLALLRQVNELSNYMAVLLAKMEALCEGLRKEG